MKAWKRVWREGMAPFIDGDGLEALQAALVTDDPRLIQYGTTRPLPVACMRDWPVEGACPLGFCGWHTGLHTVAEVVGYFTRACAQADRTLGELAACRWFITWWDDTPRDEARLDLLSEVERALARRGHAVACRNGRRGSVLLRPHRLRPLDA